MLIKCSECGKEISDKAANCPNCGNPISQQQVAHQPYIAIAHGGKIKIKTPLLDAICIVWCLIALLIMHIHGFVAFIGLVINFGWYAIYARKDWESSKDPMNDTSHLENMSKGIIAYIVVYCFTMFFGMWIKSQLN